MCNNFIAGVYLALISTGSLCLVYLMWNTVVYDLDCAEFYMLSVGC